MTDLKKLTDAELDGLFGDAKASPPDASSGLLARVAADADQVSDSRDQAQVGRRTKPHKSIIDRLVAGVGGWPGIGGLATATVAGVWIGYAQPDAINSIADGFYLGETTYDLSEFMPALGDMYGEG